MLVKKYIPYFFKKNQGDETKSDRILKFKYLNLNTKKIVSKTV